jgi:hypothetical protein
MVRLTEQTLIFSMLDFWLLLRCKSTQLKINSTRNQHTATQLKSTHFVCVCVACLVCLFVCLFNCLFVYVFASLCVCLLVWCAQQQPQQHPTAHCRGPTISSRCHCLLKSSALSARPHAVPARPRHSMPHLTELPQNSGTCGAS